MITDKPRTITQLARYYCVDVRTMRKWLACATLNGIKPLAGRYYTIAQVKVICEHLGFND